MFKILLVPRTQTGQSNFEFHFPHISLQADTLPARLVPSALPAPHWGEQWTAPRLAPSGQSGHSASPQGGGWRKVCWEARLTSLHWGGVGGGMQCCICHVVDLPKVLGAGEQSSGQLLESGTLSPLGAPFWLRWKNRGYLFMLLSSHERVDGRVASPQPAMIRKQCVLCHLWILIIESILIKSHSHGQFLFLFLFFSESVNSRCLFFPFWTSV